MSDVADQRAAALALAEAARVLNAAIVLTEVESSVAHSVAQEIGILAERLSVQTRKIGTLARIDVESSPERYFNPVSGKATPFWPPMTFKDDEPTIGLVRLGAGLEGHAGIAHGGILGLLFDEILGTAACDEEWPSVTTDLEIHFLLPVPIDEDLVSAAHIIATSGQTTYVHGSIARRAEPDRVLAYGTGTFRSLSGAALQRFMGAGASA